ncbi:MAG TPA: hypothetical protein PLA03_11690 [Acidobacteriota bacterium]|nr:hypothetical protein [Acidobacteriota bacterium]
MIVEIKLIHPHYVEVHDSDNPESPCKKVAIGTSIGKITFIRARATADWTPEQVSLFKKDENYGRFYEIVEPPKPKTKKKDEPSKWVSFLELQGICPVEPKKLKDLEHAGKITVKMEERNGKPTKLYDHKAVAEALKEDGDEK